MHCVEIFSVSAEADRHNVLCIYSILGGSVPEQPVIVRRGKREGRGREEGGRKMGWSEV